MNPNDVLGLLIYANELDGRHSPNEAKVFAWQEVLDTEAPGISLDFARDVIRKHYATVDVMVTPAVIVQAWKKYTRVKAEARASVGHTGAHCGRSTCDCAHTGPCFKGWIDGDRQTSPCRQCRPQLAAVLDEIPDPGYRSESDWSRIRNRAYAND